VFSFGRAVRPAYTIKTPSLAKRFQLSKGHKRNQRLALLRFGNGSEIRTGTEDKEGGLMNSRRLLIR